MPFLIPIVASIVIGAGAAAAVVVPAASSAVETTLPTPVQGDASAGTSTGADGLPADVDYGTR